MATPALCGRLALRIRLLVEGITAPPARGSRDRGESGQGMVEYGAIAMMVAIALILIVTVIGRQTNEMFSNVSNGMVNG